MIRITHLKKTFKNGDSTVEALRDINLTIETGDIYGIIGMSGAGKSTLVRCINALEKIDEGSIDIDGVEITQLSEKELRSFRHDITMIFQGFNLLMQKTCLKNVCFPLEIMGVPSSEAKAKAMELLALVGLEEKAFSYPSQLSGGQKQRVAIARALATNPKILLCDEATSALDPKTTNSILDLIRDINQKLGITVIMITHQMNVVENVCNRVAIIENGEIAEEGLTKDVFTTPKSDVGKRLVFPEGEIPEIMKENGKTYVSLSFKGTEVTETPLIANMALEIGVCASIVYAKTKTIDGKLYGSMILSIENKGDALKKATAYLLQNNNLFVEEI